MALTTRPRALIIKQPVAVDPASSPDSIATGMFKREGSFRRSLGGSGDDKDKKGLFALGRRSSTMSELDSRAHASPTDGPSTPSRIPAPISPSSSTKKRTLGSIFRSKSKKESTPSPPSAGRKSNTKASPSLPALGRALPLPSPASTASEDFFAKTPTKSQKPLPQIAEQSKLLSKTSSDESVPKQIPACHTREQAAPTALPSAPRSLPHATALTHPATATVTAKDFISETANHEQLRQLASRISTPPDSADSSSVKTFGSRSKAQTPPELGEVWTSKPVVATQQINLEDAVPIHVGSPSHAEDVLIKVDGRGCEREESLKKALGTSPSTWDVTAQSSRSPSPAVNSHHSSLKRSVSKTSLVQTTKTPQIDEQPLVKATFPTPSAAEAAAQASLEAAIYNTPLNPVALPPSSLEHVAPVAPAAAQSMGLEPAAAAAIPAINHRDEPHAVSNVEQPADTSEATVEPQEAVASSGEEAVKQLAEEAKSDPSEPTTLNAVEDNADAGQTVVVADQPSPKLEFTGQFASDQEASATGSRKIPLPTLPTSRSFAPAPYNAILPRVLRPKLAVELDFAHGWGWVPAVRGGWVDKAHAETSDETTDTKEQNTTPTGVHPRPTVTSWVGRVPVVGRVAGYAGL